MIENRLDTIIAHLKSLPPDLVFPRGWRRASSWRGDYSQLAFEPAENVAVADMLNVAQDALGKTFHGYKGGEFVMFEHTNCYLSEWGEASEVPATDVFRDVIEAAAREVVDLVRPNMADVALGNLPLYVALKRLDDLLPESLAT